VASDGSTLRLGRAVGCAAWARARGRKDRTDAPPRAWSSRAPSPTQGAVPRLRVALRDPAEKETQFKIMPAARLGPGETAHFKTSFDHPAEPATGVLVTFAPR